MNLYEITEEYKKAIHEYYDSKDDRDDLEEVLDSLTMSLDDKLEGCCAFYKNLEAEAEVYKSEAKKLAEEAKAIQARADRFKEYVNKCLGGGGDKWSRGVHKISWRKSASVDVQDMDKLPKEYLRVKEVIDPDKKALLASLKEGKEVPGAVLLEKNNIQIK